MNKDPFSFLNQYLPLRVHPKTRDFIHNQVLQHKPEGNPYYGMVLGQRSVAAIIKNTNNIEVVPSGKEYNV